MKKTEAISILATSVRPREAKDRERYDEAVGMAIEALKCSEIPNSSDSISRQAAIDDIRTLKPDGVLVDAKWIEMWLKQLSSAQPEPKWIPCSERVPEEGQKCLVYDKSVGFRVDTHIGHGNPFNWELFVRDYEAWMPLPEPYRGGDT